MGTKSNATSASDRGAGVNRTGADLVAAGDIGDPPLDAFDDVLASPPPPPLVVEAERGAAELILSYILSLLVLQWSDRKKSRRTVRLETQSNERYISLGSLGECTDDRAER